MLAFDVFFKELKVTKRIFAADHARATEWALVQLKQWGYKTSEFEVNEVKEEPVEAPASNKKRKGKPKK